MDQERQAERVEQLRALGLTRYEASVYLGLIMDQSAKVTEIARRTKVPQPKVYQALEALLNKGFCALGSDDVNRYRPIAPHLAIDGPLKRMEQQRTEALALADDLELLREAGEGQDLWAPPVEVVKGGRQVLDLLVGQIRAAKKEVLYFGKMPHIAAEGVAEAISERAAAGCSIRALVENEYLVPIEGNEESEREMEFFSAMNAEIRTIESLPTKLVILDGNIALVSVSRSGGDSFLVLALRHEGIVKHILASFQFHWERSQAFEG